MSISPLLIICYLLGDLAIPMVAYGFGVGQFLPGAAVNYSLAVTKTLLLL